MVIAFLQNLLKSKVISMIELSVDIKQFCVENNMIKECSDMLKKVFAEEAFQRDTKGAE